jgi:hypothetical protein
VRLNGKSWKSLILIVAAAGLLAGCGGQASTGNDQAAKDQFLEERSAAPTFTPDPNAPDDGNMRIIAEPGMMGRSGPGAIGTVEKVEGRTLTVSNPMSGAKTTIELTEDAKVFKQVEAKLSDVRVGERITAIGKQEGDTLTAEMVQVGVEEFAGAMDRPIISGGPGESVIVPRPDGKVLPSGTPITRDLPIWRGDGTMPQAVFGTVEKLDGDKITVKSPEGKTVTVQTGTDTTFQKRAEVDPSEIAVGETIVANGEKEGDVLKATQVQIMQAFGRRVP